LGEVCVWALVLGLWWVHDPSMKDAFRLPKLLVAQPLVLLSLCFLSWRLWTQPRVGLRDLTALPVLRALVPLLLLATLGLATTGHRAVVGEALVSLWIGAAALVGWNLGLPLSRRRRLVRALILPATALAAVGVLQFHGWYRPFDFAGETEGLRLGVTSFAGSAGDLALFLVLPCLVAQERLHGSRGLRRWLWGTGLGICLWSLAVTQTLSALAALAVGTAVLWGLLLPRRRALLAAGAAALAALLLVLAVTPLRERVADKGKELARGEINALLTGRLDGWRAAAHMTAQAPLTGVGHGAYRTEFADAKLELTEDGVEFFRHNRQVMFANAHNDYLEAAAEWGLPGALALAWALWVLWGALRHRWSAVSEASAKTVSASLERSDAVVAWAGVVALAVLAAAQFPFRIALVAYQAVLFLAWVLPSSPPEEVG
jgi:O-antigen ligase